MTRACEGMGLNSWYSVSPTAAHPLIADATAHSSNTPAVEEGEIDNMRKYYFSRLLIAMST
jgi:hypothetical protein